MRGLSSMPPGQPGLRSTPTEGRRTGHRTFAEVEFHRRKLRDDSPVHDSVRAPAERRPSIRDRAEPPHSDVARRVEVAGATAAVVASTPSALSRMAARTADAAAAARTGGTGFSRRPSGRRPRRPACPTPPRVLSTRHRGLGSFSHVNWSCATKRNGMTITPYLISEAVLNAIPRPVLVDTTAHHCPARLSLGRRLAWHGSRRSSNDVRPDGHPRRPRVDSQDDGIRSAFWQDSAWRRSCCPPTVVARTTRCLRPCTCRPTCQGCRRVPRGTPGHGGNGTRP